MNKLYIEGNYIIAEDSRDLSVLNIRILGSIYNKVLEPDGYTINSGAFTIPTSDIGLWFDEAGAVAYTEATLVDFLRVNTGL